MIKNAIMGLLISISEFMLKYRFTSFIFDWISYAKRKLCVKKIDKSILTNIEGITEYNIPFERFYEKKPKGLSGVARLKNAEHFLEMCLESHIPFLDELILVDNESTDKTKEICRKFQKKYPDKVKFYEYPFQVSPQYSDDKKNPMNSVHSLAYYYNWSFSKSKYSHVMKVDDDNLLIKEKWSKIKNGALSRKNIYTTYHGINLIMGDNGNYCAVKGYEYLGKFGDHGIYPVSPYTYYVQSRDFEVFTNNLRIKRAGLSFLHLKWLKPNYGTHNLKEKSVTLYKKIYLDNPHIDLAYLLEEKEVLDLKSYLKKISLYKKYSL